MKFFHIHIPALFVYGFIAIAFTLGLAIWTCAKRWDGHLYPQENCWKVQEVNGQVFKVNTCTGEVEEIKITTPANSTKVK